MAHFRICLSIAVQATSEGRRQTLGQIYDELARREWAEKARRGTTFSLFTSQWSLVSCLCAARPFYFTGDIDFKVTHASMQLDTELLNRARAVFDAHRTATGQQPSSTRAAGEHNKGNIYSLF